MREAGFAVEDGPTIGRRGPATVARKKAHDIEGNAQNMNKI
jgi:hypothetical protein